MSTLDRMTAKTRCRIMAVHGSDALSQRLMEMGLIVGSLVEVIRFAPLGDPMQVTLHGYQLSVRKSEASRIEVEPCP